MLRQIMIATSLLVGWCHAAPAAEVNDLFQTPAVEHDLYRDGEVRHLRGAFKDWQASCDEVPRLKRRFCSLYGKGRAPDGHILLGVVITTNDEGKPAAMLEMPLGVRLSSDIEVSIASAASSKKVRAPTKGDIPTRLRIVRCEIGFCMTLWQLTPSQLAALNGYGALQIVFRAPRERFGWSTLSSPVADQVVRASIASDGFRETLRATQMP